MKLLSRLFYSLLGLLLLPAISSCGICLYHYLIAAQSGKGSSTLLIWFFAGIAVWMIIFAVLPRPFRTYVLAHELSHVLWAWMMGARVSKLRVSREGGSVMVSDPNLLITLAPYFFPFYSFLALIGIVIAQLFVDLNPWRGLLAGVLGMTWAFHFSFTLLALSHEQSDIRAYGAVCAYPVILLANLLVIDLSLLAVSPLSFSEGIQLWWEFTLQAYSSTFDLIQAVIR